MQKYGLKNTHFTNFDGLHDPNHYSTVYDLAQLGRVAIQNSTLKNFVKEKELVLTDVSGQISHHIISTNELLGIVPEIEGLKTGWTPDARGSFIGLINLRGHYLISVVAQSEDRFADTKILVDHYNFAFSDPLAIHIDAQRFFRQFVQFHNGARP